MPPAAAAVALGRGGHCLALTSFFHFLSASAPGTGGVASPLRRARSASRGSQGWVEADEGSTHGAPRVAVTPHGPPVP